MLGWISVLMPDERVTAINQLLQIRIEAGRDDYVAVWIVQVAHHLADRAARRVLPGRPVHPTKPPPMSLEPVLRFLHIAGVTLWVFGLPYQPRLLLGLAAASLVLGPLLAVLPTCAPCCKSA